VTALSSPVRHWDLRATLRNCGEMDNSASASSSDFVRKLYKMLENAQDETVVRWGDQGDSFVVLENEARTPDQSSERVLTVL